ncbi:carboxymuconolactone decarboxylase family protein [Phenylobacterium sp. LjRoot219]|uniref:carboxymuconolactone decarboxylase family protein n=1 Tax=Phenylobacterium sp. LjRoot219 TaxID=3342283 RepID=UPI003ECE66FB
MDGSLIETRSGYDAAAIAERDAEINGRPQRIAPLEPEGLGQDIVELVAAVHASIGLTSPPEIDEYFGTIAKHPGIFRRQLETGTTLFTGRLAPRHRELGVLRVGWLLRAPYEWGEHVKIAQRYGVSREEIERVIEGSTAAGWSEHDAAILRGVEELIAQQSMSDATWDALAKTWDEPQLIEFLAMVGHYVATAMLQNALRIRLTEDNPGLTRR